MSGYIQVVIPRALTLHAIENGSQTSCMPVVAVRNETPETVEHITVEITYTGASGAIDHSSTVHDDIDRNEEDDRAVESLNIGPCAGATAKAYIRLCLFEDGEDCRNWVEGSEFGAIPLKGGMPRGMAGTEMHEK